MKHPAAILLPVFLLVAGLPLPSRGEVLHVPGDHARIRDALAAASAGDTVLVAAGVYSPSVNGESFPLDLVADVHLLGAGPAACVIDAEGTSTVIRLWAPGGSRVSGFTLRGGNAFSGGGIHVLAGAPEIDGNVIRACGARSRGSGIHITGGAAPWIHHNVLWENFDSDLVDPGDPHGIQTDGGAGTIENNLIGRGDSNGLFIDGGDEPVVRNNIFLENGEPGLRGRGICHFGGPNTVIAHNLFFGNAVAAILVDAGGILDFSAAEANALSPGDGIHGNLDGDPDFMDPEGDDWTLRITSPAIDAGDPLSPADPDGTPADIGPFFFDQSVTGVPLVPGPAILAAPNPFRTRTTFSVGIREDGGVLPRILDARGRAVRTLDDGASAGGVLELTWDGRDDSGRRVPAGVYFLRADPASRSRAIPVVLLP